MGAESIIPYCPRCTCEFCTAQRNLQLYVQQRTYEYLDKVDQERIERETREEQIRLLNDRVCAATWMLVLGHPRARHRELVKTLATHMETSAGTVGGRLRVYLNRLQERLYALRGDYDAPIQRLRAVRAITDDVSWAKMEHDYLPETCTICGGTYPEGRHCKRNSCRRKRGR